ncbi:MAG: zinc-ribbon domain-containing protein, partial [Acidobacteriota bacterium]
MKHGRCQMNVTCSACQTLYNIDAAKVPATGAFMKCKSCGERINIAAPAAPGTIPAAGDAPNAPAPASTVSLDAGPAAGDAPNALANQTLPLAGSPTLLATPAPAPVPAPSPAPALSPAPAAGGATAALAQATATPPPTAPPGAASPAVDLPVDQAPAPVAEAPLAPSGEDVSIFDNVPPEPPHTYGTAEVAVERDPAAGPVIGGEGAQVALPVDAEAGSAKEAPAQAAAVEPDEPALILSAAPRRLAPLTLIGALLVVVILGGLVGLVVVATPFFDLQLIDPLGLAEVTPPPPMPGSVPAEPIPIEEQPPVAPIIPDLTVANVDQLGYQSLRAATAELTKKAPANNSAAAGLLTWAMFRLAQRFGDDEVRHELLATPTTPTDVAKRKGLGVAAGIGCLALSGKGSAARKIAERLQHNKSTASPQLAYVLALSLDKRPDQTKALNELARAAQLGSKSTDPELLRGQILLLGKEPTKGIKALVALATASKDAEVRLTVADRLFAAGQTQELDAVLEGVGFVALDEVPPNRRAVAARLILSATLRAG